MTSPAFVHYARLLELVHAELGLAPDRLSTATPLAELGDSLDWVHLLDAVEEAFGVRISDPQSQRLKTLGDLLALLAPEPAHA
jgi:acyl carrier protein